MFENIINKNTVKSALAALAVYLFLLFENKGITVSRLNIDSKKINDENDGLKIVHISDLQNAELGKRNKRLINKIKKLAPDMIVITGDIVDCHRTNVYCALDFVKNISRICKVYYVCGNHEGVLGNYQRLCADLEESGAVVLNDESVYFDGYKNIRLTGLTDPYFKFNDDMGRLLSNIIDKDREAFNIVLSHRPQLIDNVYAPSQCDLVFSGHAHGGQIRLPFIGGLFSPDQGLFPKYTKGVYQKGRTRMIVSRGLGNSVFPFRLFNRPEIVLCCLKKI